MKNIFYYTVVIFLALSLLFSCKNEETRKKAERRSDAMMISEASNVIIICSDEWMPFNGEPDSVNPGYMVELVREIFESEGYVVDYQLMPWNRSLKYVREGAADAVIGAAKPEGPGFIFPAEPIYSLPADSFYVLHDNPWRYDRVDSLQSVRVGCLLDYDYGSKELQEYLELNKGTLEVQISGGDKPLESNIKKLLFGRIDTLIASPPVLFWKLREMKLDHQKIINAGSIGQNLDPFIYIAFSPVKSSSPEYAALFDRKMRELKSSERFKKILEKYGLEPF